MPWLIEFHADFYPEFEALPEPAQNGLLSVLVSLREMGPLLARPHADTLKGSKHANMKELRFAAQDGVWRFAFAFDPGRMAIILCGGDKSGSSERRFYERLIAKADARFDSHLVSVKGKTQ